jgi:hypothetical protein
MKYSFYPRTVLIPLVLYSSFCLAQTPRNVLDVTRDDNMMRSELADTIINRETKAKWLLPIINALAFDDQATTKSPTTLFVRNTSQAIYDVLSRMPDDSLSASDYNALQALIDFRNDILKTGGSANVCLAGSITAAIHGALFHAICHEKTYDLEAIENVALRNQVPLGQVFAALTKDDRWATRSTTIDPAANDVEVAKQYLMQIGVEDFNQGNRIWAEAFTKDPARMNSHFGRSLLKTGGFLSYFGLFVALADNQRILLLTIDYEKEIDKPIWDYFQTEIEEQEVSVDTPIKLDEDHVRMLSEDMDAFFQNRSLPLSIKTLQPISKDQVLRQILTRCWLPDVRERNYHLVKQLLDYDESGLSAYYDRKERLAAQQENSDDN